MTKRECKKRFRSACRKYNNQVRSISGQYLPGFIRQCNNYIQLAGRAIALVPTAYLSTSKNNGYYRRAQRALRDAIGVVTTSPSDACAISVEQLSAAYLNLLRAEMQLGTIRVACISSPYKSDTNVRSHYGSWNINYSPLIVEIAQMDSVEALAQHFADCLLSNRQCNLLTFDFKHSVKEEDFPVIQEMAIEMAECFNRYFIKEFEERQYDTEYQHRDDWDPLAL